jgi:ribonuclease HII
LIELELIQKFPATIIAVDEAGRGPVAGPVVVGAIRLDIQNAQALSSIVESLRMLGVTDSKKLTPKKRLSLLSDLGIMIEDYRKQSALTDLEVKISYLSWEMDHQVIDAENILSASLRAMKEASLSLLNSEKKQSNVYILIDGHMKLRWAKEEEGIKQSLYEFPIVKGDMHSALIGLASIIGKEKRDQWMHKMDEIYPQYEFKKHFGYPTAKHKELIKKFGPSPIHRLTFKGVKEYI